MPGALPEQDAGAEDARAGRRRIGEVLVRVEEAGRLQHDVCGEGDRDPLAELERGLEDRVRLDDGEPGDRDDVGRGLVGDADGRHEAHVRSDLDAGREARVDGGARGGGDGAERGADRRELRGQVVVAVGGEEGIDAQPGDDLDARRELPDDVRVAANRDVDVRGVEDVRLGRDVRVRERVAEQVVGDRA